MVYRHAPGINTSSKDPTSLVSAEAIPVLYLISLVRTWGNISLVPCTSFIPVTISDMPPTSQKSVLGPTPGPDCVCVFLFFFEHNTRPDLTSRWHLQVKLNEGPAGISPAHHWVWTQDLLWSQGPRRCYSRAGVNQQPPMHQLRMSPFSPFCGWTSSLPEVFFFFTSSLSHLPPPSYPPSYLPPTNPTPPHSIAKAWVVERKLELWSCCCGAVELCSSCGAVAVESEQELECPWDPRTHDQVRCLPFFFFFCVCFVWRGIATLQCCNSAAQHSNFSFFFFSFFFFLLFFFFRKESDGSNAAITVLFSFYNGRKKKRRQHCFLCWASAQL